MIVKDSCGHISQHRLAILKYICSKLTKPLLNEMLKQGYDVTINEMNASSIFYINISAMQHLTV